MSNGFVEQFNSKRISGWARIDITEKITVIIDNDEYLVTPGSERADTECLSRMFSFDLPQKYLGRDTIDVSVLDAQKEHLQNSPLKIVLSPRERGKVLVGLDGWLFLYNDSNQSLDYLTGNKTVTPERLHAWYELTKNRHKVCRENGIELITVVCPEKETIYSNYLPADIKIDKQRPLNVIQMLCKEDEEINFLVPDFDTGGARLSFSKGDSHWTYWGAFQAYTQLIKKYIPDIKVTNEDDFSKSIVYQASDLLIKRDTINIEPVEYWKSNAIVRETFNNHVSNRGRRQEYINKSVPKKRIMIWHTSSIDWMKPFLFNDFSDVCLIWLQNISWQEVWRYNPDILIVQTNERFIVNVPQDNEDIDYGF